MKISDPRTAMLLVRVCQPFPSVARTVTSCTEVKLETQKVKDQARFLCQEEESISRGLGYAHGRQRRCPEGGCRVFASIRCPRTAMAVDVLTVYTSDGVPMDWGSEAQIGMALAARNGKNGGGRWSPSRGKTGRG